MSEDTRYAFFRQQEALFDVRIPDGIWIVLRLDGRSFSALTETHFQKPFDPQFQEYMLYTAKEVFRQLDASYAYVGSDEITLVLKPAFYLWNRRLTKLLSLSAGIASAAFTAQSSISAQFDCRLLPFTQQAEALACCVWRMEDVRKNALQTLCYWTLRQNKISATRATHILRKASSHEKRDLLAGYGLRFDTLPSWQQQGASILWETYEKEGYNPKTQLVTQTQRRTVAVRDIPEDYLSWLEQYITALP